MRFRARPDVLFQQVDGEGVLLSLAEEVYFGVNEVAAEIWQLLQQHPCSEAGIVEYMRARYPEVPRATLAADVAELLAELRANDLLEQDEHAPDAPALPVPPVLSRAG